MELNIFKIKKIRDKYFNNDYYCPFCNRKTLFKNFGDPTRKNVQCSICESLERHRFLFFVYKIIFLGTKSNINLLHMAPEKCLYDLLKNFNNINYTAADLNPDNFSFVNCRKEDFTQMTFKDKTFDIILSNQVIEHIEKEQQYLKEMNRCLKDDGLIIINIPFKVGLKQTFERENIKSEKERKLYYGQEDHVRLYGEDTGSRFEKFGFIVNQINEDIFGDVFLKFYRLKCINSNNINPGGYFLLKKKLS